MRKTGIPMPIRTKHIVVATEQSRKETILAVAVQQTEGISRSQEGDHSSRRRSGTCSSYTLTNHSFIYILWTSSATFCCTSSTYASNPSSSLAIFFTSTGAPHTDMS